MCYCHLVSDPDLKTLSIMTHRDHDGVLPEHVHVMRNSTDGFLWHGREISWRVTLNQ
jgi:hypothetical protein